MFGRKNENKQTEETCLTSIVCSLILLEHRTEYKTCSIYITSLKTISAAKNHITKIKYTCVEKERYINDSRQFFVFS